MKKIIAISLVGLISVLLACGATTTHAEELGSKGNAGTKAAITFIEGDDTGTTDSSGSGGTDSSSSGGIGGGGTGNSSGTNGSGGTSVTVPGGKKPIFPQTGEARASLLGIIGIAIIGGLVLFAWRRKKAQTN